MNCEEIQAQLSDFLEHSLGAAPKALIEEHLAVCAPCREEAELLAESIRQVAALPVVEPPLGFTQRVMGHVRDTEAHPRYWQRLILTLRGKIPLQAAALVVVGVLGIYLLQEEEPHNQSKPATETVATDAVRQESSQPTTGVEESQSATGKAPGTGAVTEEPRAASPQPAPESSARAASTISGTPVANHASSQGSGNPMTFSFPMETDTVGALRSGPAAIQLFADFELFVRRHRQESVSPRGDAERAQQRLEAERTRADRPSTPRTIDRLMTAIPDHTRPQTIWIIVPKNQYEQFKKELQSLGTIESETHVPLLRDQSASQSDGQIRVKLTAVPAADSSAPNRPAGR